MKDLIMFKSHDCEYCRMAKKFIEQTIEKIPEYKKISLQILDEDENLEFSMKFEYDYVPAFFADGIKVHEGITTREKIEAILADAYGQ